MKYFGMTSASLVILFAMLFSTQSRGQCTEFTGTSESGYVSHSGAVFTSGTVCGGDGDLIEFSGTFGIGTMDFVYGPVSNAGSISFFGSGEGFFTTVSFTVGFRNTSSGPDVVTETHTPSPSCSIYRTANSIAVGQYVHVSATIDGGRLSFDKSCIDRSHPLPVELASFHATSKPGKSILHWTTATELNNYGFEVQKRRGEEGIWEPIGFVPGAGESATPLDYEFEDSDVGSYTNYYRLKQMDRDGTTTYSSEICVLPAASEIETLDAFPNPMVSSGHLAFGLDTPQSVSISIYDLSGRLVRRVTDAQHMDAGYAFIPFDLTDVAPGQYVVTLHTNSGVQTTRISKLR